MAAVGGKYAALMGGKKKSGSAAVQKPKAAKVISLKDTAEKNPAPQSNKKPAVAKKPEPTKKPVEAEKERDLTKREVKHERAGTDRHVPRSGHADHTKDKKNEQVAEALDAEKPTEMSEKRREFEERDAERKKREEEEERKVTYADYQKTLVEKKAELARLQKAQERKVDTKNFATFTEVKKDEESAGFLKMKKAGKAEQPAAPVKKNGKKVVKEVEAAPVKKNKFHKSSDIQLGFFIKPTQAKQNNFRPRRDFKDAEKKDEKPAEEPATVETQEETPAAEAAETTEA